METEVNCLGALPAETRRTKQSRGTNTNKRQQRRRFWHRHINSPDIANLRTGIRATAAGRLRGELAHLELVCARNSRKRTEHSGAGDCGAAGIRPRQIPKAWIVRGIDQTWCRTHQRCGKCPPDRLRMGRRHDRAKIVNSEKVTVIDRFVHGYVCRVIPSEIRTRSRYGR